MMNFGEYIRYNAFWFLDTLKGGPLKRQLEETNFILSSSDSSTVNQDNLNKLQALINHAVASTEFYKNVTSRSLEDFSVINKNSICKNLKNITSDKFKLKNCKKVCTSGSTGTPFSVYYNKDKINKNVADNIYFSSKSNFKIGDNLVYLKIWQEVFNRKDLLMLKLRHISPRSVYDLSSNGIDDLIEGLNASKKTINMMSYASALEKICWHIDKKEINPIRFKTNSIITISEALNAYTRKAVKNYFGVSPMARYSNNENGILAQQISESDLKYRINNSSFHIEIFSLKEDKKLNHGEMGRIVVTDLYNYATPLIRYDTGDVGMIELDKENRPYFAKVLGRKLDLLYDTKGNLISEYLAAKIWKYGRFKQIQLIQKQKKEYHICLNTLTKIDEEKLKMEFLSYLGDDALIKIKYVDEIPLLKSGKRRFVVNEYYL